MNNINNRNRLLPLLLAVLVSTACARTRGLSEQKPSLRERPARQAMESIVTLAERRECVPLTEVNQISTEARSAQLQEGCSPEACAGPTSCCRVLTNALVCDTDNQYPFSACVCNDYTRTRTPTRSPSATPPPAPTDAGSDTGGTTNNDSGTTDGGSTVGNTGGTTDGGNTGENTGGTDGTTGGSAGGSAGGNTGGTNDGSSNADTSGNNGGGFDQVNMEIETAPEDDEWWLDPKLMGSVGAGVFVLCVGVLLLTHKFRKETSSRQSRPVKSLAYDADASSAEPRVEQHVELESVQSDYELNDLPPQDEESSMSQQQKDKCCQVQACNDFGNWMDNICAPKRARSYETKDTVNL